ncbi:unnamed protein product [Paramecium octaurelia]|uniref:Tubulin/FtsZ GTPase domain-containing protein n=1 Tax=Paramecium octaurelia TaxID=43137 RepID=A0A8S1XSR7_PAROT|nr:unnamed protein product [Paramecium octaurelia]
MKNSRMLKEMPIYCQIAFEGHPFLLQCWLQFGNNWQFLYIYLRRQHNYVEELCDDGNHLIYDGYSCQFQCQEECADCQPGNFEMVQNEWQIISFQQFVVQDYNSLFNNIMTSSAIPLHLEGAEVMIGDALWKLYEKEESDINVKGYIYNENENNHYPLALFVDSDDQMINKVKKYQSIKYRSRKEDASNNYCRGYFALGKELINQKNKQKVLTDQINITSALSGGTGSGFATYLLKKISIEYGRKTQKNAFLVYPSQKMSNNIVDFYNIILSTELTSDLCGSVVMLDNQQMYETIDSQIGLDSVYYTHLNNLILQLITSYTY